MNAWDTGQSVQGSGMEVFRTWRGEFVCSRLNDGCGEDIVEAQLFVHVPYFIVFIPYKI